jgi:hypothetical protein
LLWEGDSVCCVTPLAVQAHFDWQLYYCLQLLPYLLKLVLSQNPELLIFVHEQINTGFVFD